jgi:fumarylacetoacetate (FAA) hydrolase
VKLATVWNGTPDGQLVVVSRDGLHFTHAGAWPTLQQALEQWGAARAELETIAASLEGGAGHPVEDVRFAAPLPRAWQWLDGSAFDTHGRLMQKAFNLEPIEHDKPLMYQGMSHQFLGPNDDVPVPSESDGIDFEGEFGVIVDEVAMGTSADEAMAHIRLIVQINDWSLRTIAPQEMKTGFGWVQAKPACSVAPFAVTPDELGDSWTDGRVHLDLQVRWNSETFGNANGAAMSVGFHELVAHAAATRSLCAGTIIGSGTVSNDNYREVGSSCISERRAIEMMDDGEAKTPFMSFGDTIFMESRTRDGALLFGAIDQKVVRS